SPTRAAPRTFAYQPAAACAAEVPRHAIAARARVFIRDHHLWPEDSGGVNYVRPVARRQHARLFTQQVLDNIRGEMPAMIEALVDDRRFLAHLREEVAGGAGVSWESPVRHIYIGD